MPTPPPDLNIRAASEVDLIIASMSSCMSSTKHAESWPSRPPAFIIVGELGRYDWDVIMSMYSVMRFSDSSNFLAASISSTSLKLTFMRPSLASVM